MWAVLVLAAATVILGVKWHRSGKTIGEFLGLLSARLYASLWHRCRTNGPAPFPAAGPGIVVSNHTCSADPTFIHSAGTRVIGYLTAREHYQNSGPFRRFLGWMRCVPVTRDCNDVGAVRSALRLLEEGHMLGIFPEGNLSGVAKNRIRPGKAGVALLALRSRAPVFPVYIAGGPRTERILRAWLWPSRIPVRVYYGKRVNLSAYFGRPITRTLLEEVTRFIMDHVAALRPGHPCHKPTCSIKPRGPHVSTHDGRIDPQTLCSV
jgi:1-acyl-sn-glycerol-3-phosphate acyltransferase